MSQTLETLKRIADKESARVASDVDPALVKQSVEYLQSDEALLSIEIDPYWPKWNSPWWHMLLLHELDLTSDIPEVSIMQMIAALNKHYLPIFPVREEELPAGVDPLGQIACHCQLGEIEQVLSTWGVDVVNAVPALRSWYFHYQLADGGLNCDESAYVKDNPASSIVSTLPPLEAVLFSRKYPLSNEDILFLERGAKYLADKKLFRSVRTGSAINESWTELCFPRFFEYDCLRGLNFLLSWSLSNKSALTAVSIIETVSLIDRKFPDGCVFIERSIWASTKTRYLNTKTNTWSQRLSSGFSLLESVSVVGSKSAVLTRQWKDVKLTLSQLLQEGLIGV